MEREDGGASKEGNIGAPIPAAASGASVGFLVVVVVVVVIVIAVVVDEFVDVMVVAAAASEGAVDKGLDEESLATNPRDVSTLTDSTDASDVLDRDVGTEKGECGDISGDCVRDLVGDGDAGGEGKYRENPCA